ncbi:MAG: AAA family ATPase [Myxococcales bacterium]|nr:AAA family ATPase [Myxococcales bacterium]
MLLPFPTPSGDAPTIAWQAPAWRALADEAWAQAMAACPQDPEHHAEGDVWTHTRMVCDALVALPAWRALPVDERDLVFAACLLHDVAKPPCTRIEGGRIRQPGHSVKGAIMARNLLWRAGVDPRAREAIVGLIRYHQVPFFCIDEADPIRRLAQVSQRAQSDHLALVNRADALGRICAGQERLLENVDLFLELARDQGCLRAPFAFADDHSRFTYFRGPAGADPRRQAHDDTRCEAILMSGLPGSGKDTWLAAHADLPVISLDAIRSELGKRPSGDQGAVLSLARERAREHLRAGRSFAWNATNLTREIRGRLVDLFAGYGARVRIVYLEVPHRTLLRQNRGRAAAVPEAVIERMTRLWEIPDATEAHVVEHHFVDEAAGWRPN